MVCKATIICAFYQKEFVKYDKFELLIDMKIEL